MNWLLLIDTSIQGAAVGFAPASGEHAGELQWSQVIDVVGDSGRQLPLSVESGLRQCGLNQEQISGIVISTGPGSFTGLRIGLAYAMGLASGIEASTGRCMKWLGVSALGLMAKEKSSKTTVVYALPATKTAGYAAIAEPQQDQPLLMPLNLSEELPWTKETAVDLHIVGEWSLLAERFGLDRISTTSAKDVSAQTLRLMAGVGSRCWPHGFATSMPPPNYLRKSTVEEQAAAKIQLSAT